MATGGKVDIFENLSVNELPPRNFEQIREYKRDMENSGLDQNKFKSAMVNSIVKFQVVLVSFAASGQWIDQNKVYKIGCDIVKVLREVENAFLKLRLSAQEVLECSRSAYDYADEGFCEMAQKNLGVVEQEMKKLDGYFLEQEKEMKKLDGQFTEQSDKKLPVSLLSRMDNIVKEMTALNAEYTERRVAMQNGFESQSETKKKTLKEEMQKRDNEFEEKNKQMIIDVDRLRAKWFFKDSNASKANRIEEDRKRAELEQREKNEQFQKDIESLQKEIEDSDEIVFSDPKGRGLQGAIDAFKALTLYLQNLQGLLSCIQVHYTHMSHKQIVGLGYDGDLQALVRQKSSRLEIIKGHCRWMALEDFFQDCFSQLHLYYGRFCKELATNPTKKEARQKLNDSAWIGNITASLKSLEKSDQIC